MLAIDEKSRIKGAASVLGVEDARAAWGTFAGKMVGYSHHPRTVKHATCPNMPCLEHDRISQVFINDNI